MYSQVEQIRHFRARGWITKTQRDRLFRLSTWNPNSVDQKLSDIQWNHTSLTTWWGYAFLIVSFVFKVLHQINDRPYQGITTSYLFSISTDSVPLFMMLAGIFFISIG